MNLYLRFLMLALVLGASAAYATAPAAAASFSSGIEAEMIRIPGKSYELGKYEVTQGQWRAVMGSNPSHFLDCGENCPVDQVSWSDVQAFIQKLNAKTGKQYRLPTEGEWEYACYGKARTEYCGGSDLDTVGWYEGNSRKQTHPVGQKQPNDYGLYDMSGNVLEWTNGCYDSSCAKRMLRGGSWSSGTTFGKAAERFRIEPIYRSSVGGLRLARTLP